MKLGFVIFHVIILMCSFLSAKGEKPMDTSLKRHENLLPIYSIAKERGHTKIDCAASSNLLASAPGQKETSNSNLHFSCHRDEGGLVPSCKIGEIKKGALSDSNRRLLETTLSRGLLFYFSKNRVEALAGATKTSDGWVAATKNRKSVVQISTDMTELKMPEVGIIGKLTTIDGFLFLKEITSADKYGKSTTGTEYVKSGEFFYPSSVRAEVTFKEKSHLDVLLKITNCTSR